MVERIAIDVSIIMINYNAYNLTRNALGSLFQFTNDVDFEVILVDNKSSDGSGENCTRNIRVK